VIEVALAVQFSPPIDTFTVARFIGRVRSKFPQRQEQPPRAPMDEDFSTPPSGPQIQFEMVERPPMPRFWLLAEDERRLIQIQDNMFTLNWRKLDSGDEYPRYPALRNSLAERIADFEEAAREEGATALAPNWCEVTYVNHVLPVDGRDRPRLAQVLRAVSDERAPNERFLPVPEDVQFLLRFIIKVADEPIGRLHITAVPAFRNEDQVPIYVLTLIARIRANAEGLGGALDRLDLGREWIVRGFREVTTEQMHDVWGLHR
jgi:uncharacterized protein (TIGR04255 family)